MDHPEGREDAARPAACGITDLHRCRRTWRYGEPTRLIEERLIIATAVVWPSLSEASDATWKSTAIEVGGVELVIASRLEG